MKWKFSVSLIILILILLLAAFMRLYLISDYMTFLGDEGRDVIVAKGILDGHFTLLGPRASAGDFFTGPIYYYMMAPFLWLFHLDPVGPAVMVALFGIATVWLVYHVGKQFFNKTAGLVAAALYAVSPLVINYSHSSWNPNVVPFFALLTVYLLYKAVTTVRSWKYYLLVGVLLGICIQLHYISLFLAVIVAVSLFLMHGFLNNWKIKILPLIKYYLEIFVGFLIGYAPFLAFEARHGFPNTRTILKFITSNSGQGYETYHTFNQPIQDVFFRLFGRLIFDYPTPDNHAFSSVQLEIFALIVLIIAAASIIVMLTNKNKFVVISLSVWLALGVFLFGFYKKPIYDYYFVFMFPLPFLLVGNLVSKLFELKKGKWQYGIVLGVLLFLGIFAYNLRYQPFQYAPNKQKDQAETIARFVISQTDNMPYNFALLSTGSGNSDYAYQYYLMILGHPPVTINNTIDDPQRKTVTGQLMVVCEYSDCKPLGNSLWEIAGFGRAAIWKTWNVSVVKVIRLVHYQEHSAG